MSEDRKQLRNLAERATPGPWELQTSNSWRRIGTAGGRGADGNVLAPTNHRGDNHPDLDARQEDLNFIVAANPSTVLDLLDEIAILRAQSERLAYEARFARTWAEMTVRKEVGRAESEGLAYKMESDQLKAENARWQKNYEHLIEQHMPRTGHGCEEGWSRVVEARELSASNAELLDALKDALCALECSPVQYDHVMGKARRAIGKAMGDK